MVDEHIGLVAHTLQRAGVPTADLDDEIQRTFIAAADRLEDVRFGAERRFLFQTARNVALHARRTLGRRREVLTDEPPDGEAHATPEHLADRRRMDKLVADIVDSLDDSLRTVFRLFELEDVHTTEIARMLGLPRGTIASRLRRARKQLRTNVAAIQLARELGASGAANLQSAAPSRRRTLSLLERALLRAGAYTFASSSAHAKTLAALGLVDPGARH
jgi:RNA polymerase sigma-70 factor (ECF subfamily)